MGFRYKNLDLKRLLKFADDRVSDRGKHRVQPIARREEREQRPKMLNAICLNLKKNFYY